MANTSDTGADNTLGGSTAKSADRKPAKPKVAKSTTESANGAKAGSEQRTEARTRFNAAIDEAKAGVSALKSEALAKGSEYRKTATAGTADWVDEAKAMGGQAKQRAAELARDGKTRASDGLATLGKTVSDNAAAIDDKLGAQYGDYARTAARTLQDTAAKLDAKDFNELGDDAREFVRKSPGAAIGIAAVAGFFLAKLFRGSSSD